MSPEERAKEIGIVLTPRHITKFAVDVLDVRYNDYVFDPACGTGGFLVSAFDYVRNTAKDKQINEFKDFHLFGIEQDDEVLALALVNMIFRGDGRNNMSEGNCFQKNIEKILKKSVMSGEYVKRAGQKPKNLIVTKVLMNPPFALKKGDEKESHFIDYALSQMQDGGVLFAIVPISVMVEASGKDWRKGILENNSLLSVVTFPEDLFNPSASVGTIGIFIKKGIPHSFKNQKVYFARPVKDGYKMKKGKRISNKNVPNLLEDIKEELKTFLINQNLNFKNIPEFKKICLLDEQNKNFELVPEIYIDNKTPSTSEIESGVEELVKSCVSYIIKNK